MKLQFKKQQFQLDAVSAIADLFQGQAKHNWSSVYGGSRSSQVR